MTVLQAKTYEKGDFCPGRKIPPLKTGDRLSRDEFDRRYEEMPHVKSAELIEGVVYMGSPVSADHGSSHGETMGWLAIYCFATPGVKLYDNTTLCLDDKNEFQPDAMIRTESDRRLRINKSGYLEGAPELVTEISVSSGSQDIGKKKRVYQRIGVQEYIVWQVHKKRLDWFELREGEYQPLVPDESGVIHSRVFPGLRLKVDALLNGDLTGVSTEAQKGLQSEEHSEFIRKLTT